MIKEKYQQNKAGLWLILKLQKQPPEVFYKKGILKFRKIRLWQSLFFNKVAGLQPY